MTSNPTLTPGGDRGRRNAARWLREIVRSGTIAAMVMIPFGIAFRLLGWRINEYGLKVLDALFGNLTPVTRVALALIQHLIVSWGAALPLLAMLVLLRGRVSGGLVGAAYGAGFYIVMNSLVLPWWFGDVTPWQLGWGAVLPSLVAHVAYGTSIAVTARRFAARDLGAVS